MEDKMLSINDVLNITLRPVAFGQSANNTILSALCVFDVNLMSTLAEIAIDAFQSESIFTTF
jgi:hypothetical protein